MKESIYKKYCEQKLPHNFQKQAEGFASMSDTVQEEMFRAGFYCDFTSMIFSQTQTALFWTMATFW